MKQYQVDVVAGARPNFIKIAPLFAQSENFPDINLRFIHTGQHYDKVLADDILRDLELPAPTSELRVGGADPAKQTAEIIERYDRWLAESRPDLCIVVGDVTSTLACSIAAKKKCVPLAHIEAGLRSFDRSMPEEINRIVTDSISDYLFASEPSGLINLAKEGKPESSIFLVGNVMIDTLLRLKETAGQLNLAGKMGLAGKRFALLTLHRPVNVDNKASLTRICQEIGWLSQQMSVVFPVHPRTLKRLIEFDLLPQLRSQEGLLMQEPLSYLELLSLLLHSALVVTDSGGLQEESTFLGIPCLTLRENTERPVTIALGTNVLIKSDWELFRKSVVGIEDVEMVRQVHVPYWDGKAAERIMSKCLSLFRGSLSSD